MDSYSTTTTWTGETAQIPSSSCSEQTDLGSEALPCATSTACSRRCIGLGGGNRAAEAKKRANQDGKTRTRYRSSLEAKAERKKFNKTTRINKNIFVDELDLIVVN